MYDALKKAVELKMIPNMPDYKPVAAISVGIIKGNLCLDLCYEEDSHADVDLNIIMDNELKLIEVQGTAEHNNFTRIQLNQMLDLGEKGIKDIFNYTKQFMQ